MTTCKWGDIKATRLTHEEIATIRQETEAEVLDMNLKALREVSGKTQIEMAQAIEMTQGELSRLEKREDHLVSTLRKYIQALGGEMVVVAQFADKSVRLRGV